MDRFVWLFAILVALFLAACDSNSPGGIRLHYSWVDSEGNDITPPDLSLLFAWGELKYGSETKTSEAAWLGDDDATLRFTGLPYGVSMSLTLTMRAADTEGDDSDIIGLDDVPEVRTDNIVYYCTSQAFSLTRGKVTDVLNACVMQKGAAWNDDGSGAPAMRLFYAARGTGEPVELTAEANVTPHAAIEIHVDPRTADSIVAANDPAFTIGRTAYAVAALSKDIDGFAIIPAWDLNGGLFTEQGTAPDGVRVIYVKLKQNIGFESPAADAKVVLDTTPPRVVSRSFLRDPAYAPSTEEAGNDDASGADELPDDDTLPAEETTKVYHLSAHDPLAQGATVTGMLTLFADEPVSGAAAFVRNVNTDEVMTLGDIGLLLSSVAQNEMTFSGPITDDPTLDGTYEVLVQLTDAVENADEEPVAVEQLLLILHNTTPTTENVDMGKVRYRRIPWGSDETEGTPRFSVVAEPGAVAGGDIATAIAYRAEEASPGNIIGTAAVGSDGSFTVTDMTGGDLPNIYLSLATRSGAVMPPTLITEVEWIATMGEKVPGSILENPHTLITTGTITQTLEQKGYFFQEPPGGGSEEIVRSGIGSWAQRNNDNGVPSMRSGHAMAYDSAHGKVLVFGGNAGGEYSDETWEWDGTNWTLLNPATKPSARAMHAMTYDSARGKVVLFGGVAGAYNNETWEWDGTNWTLMTPANKPTARTSHAMAYDSVRGKVVLFGGEFGGENGPENYDETWEWDGANWTQLNPMNKPSARSCHAMVYDSGHGSVILFGGINYPDYFSIVEKNDTWEWDGQNWTQLNPASKPSARGYHAMAYYSTRGKVVLFGGSSGDDETWEWDGTNWTQMSPATKPSARHGHAMAYDGARGKMVLFGENTDSAWNVETWEWDGADWTLWHTVNSPSARIMLAMAHDETRRRVLLFGGWTGEYNDETWEWSGNNWTQLNPATKPSARCSHAMAYDSERGKMVLFGGETGESAYSDDTWEWDGQNWTQLNPASKPSARSAHAMAYDSERGKVVLFGGETGESAYSDDTW
ncbi:MAG TPA: kelch repeat-containing protein, partial [bacterium]|nr:kelch repeat-containing protein [bacterium]